MDMAKAVEPFKDILGLKGDPIFSESDRETIYSAAYGQYQAGEYETAGDYFHHLVLYNPKDTRYWIGLASAKQMAKDYHGALQAWAVLVLLSKHDPAGHFHAAECYLSLGDKEEAKKAIRLARHFAPSGHPLSENINQVQEIINGR